MSATEFSLFTSLRYDPTLILTAWNNKSPLLLTSFHIQRLQEAALKFEWEGAIQTTQSDTIEAKFKAICKEAVQSYKGEDQALLLRILLSRSGHWNWEVIPTALYPFDLMFYATYNPDTQMPPYPDFCWRVFLDVVATPSSEFTSFKTTRRDHYNNARSRGKIKSRGELKEIMLYNERHEITEGSVTNIYFWRDGHWVTPPMDSGCLPGTVRRWMLQRGLTKEGVILENEVHEGEYVLLSNGVAGIQLGKVAFLDQL